MPLERAVLPTVIVPRPDRPPAYTLTLTATVAVCNGTAPNVMLIVHGLCRRLKVYNLPSVRL